MASSGLIFIKIAKLKNFYFWRREMALIPYKKLLTMAKEAVSAAMAPLRAREMKKKAELEMAKIESSLMEHDSKIQTYASAYPIDFDKLIDAIDEKALLERRHKKFGLIVAEMFDGEAEE